MNTLSCPDCGAPMELRPSRFGQFYGCSQYRRTGCPGTHGAHPDGTPMGTPATAPTKRARIAAHEAFDRLWKSGAMKRRTAYKWLSGAMQMPSEQAHISRFDISQCERLVALVEQHLAANEPARRAR